MCWRQLFVKQIKQLIDNKILPEGFFKPVDNPDINAARALVIVVSDQTLGIVWPSFI